jgi:hypothetical protein
LPPSAGYPSVLNNAVAQGSEYVALGQRSPQQTRLAKKLRVFAVQASLHPLLPSTLFVRSARPRAPRSLPPHCLSSARGRGFSLVGQGTFRYADWDTDGSGPHGLVSWRLRVVRCWVCLPGILPGWGRSYSSLFPLDSPQSPRRCNCWRFSH